MRRCSPAKIKDAAALFASGVTVVMSGREGALHGVTVSAFSCVSIEPPLVLVCVNERSRIRQMIEDCRAFSVNVLAQQQLGLSNRFAKPGREPVATLDEPHVFGGTGVPILTEAVAHFECELNFSVTAGDHAIFVGHVLDAVASGERPLVYFNRDYKALTAIA